MQKTGYANMSRMGSHFGDSYDAKLTQLNLQQSIHEDHVFDVIGEMQDGERDQIQTFQDGVYQEQAKTPSKNDDG
jgi:hypothetical protein